MFYSLVHIFFNKDLTDAAAAYAEMEAEWVELLLPENQNEYQRLYKLSTPWRDRMKKEADERKKKEPPGIFVLNKLYILQRMVFVFSATFTTIKAANVCGVYRKERTTK